MPFWVALLAVFFGPVIIFPRPFPEDVTMSWARENAWVAEGSLGLCSWWARDFFGSSLFKTIRRQAAWDSGKQKRVFPRWLEKPCGKEQFSNSKRDRKKVPYTGGPCSSLVIFCLAAGLFFFV